MTKNKIAIIGMGWLGEQIYSSLKEAGESVFGTRTKESTDTHSVVLSFPTNNYSSVEKANTFIICIPPSKVNSEDFINFREYFKDKNFIFISTSSVFDKSQGQVNELTPPLPTTARGKRNLGFENIFSKDCIIRCSGLIGPRRHPINSLAGKYLDPSNYLNLIHSNDIIKIIKIVLKSNFKGIIHASYQTDMTKKEYYVEYAKRYDLTPPLFTSSKNKSLKVNSKVLDQWNYQFENNLF